MSVKLNNLHVLNKVKDVIQNPIFKRYLFNSSWMMIEQSFRILAGVFVGIYIARYLGPEQFGVLSYVLSISAFIVAVARLGMDAILVRELVNSGENRKQLLGTAFWLMISAALACYCIAAIAIWYMDEITEIKIYACIVSASAFFTSFLVVDYFFLSQLQAKYSAISKTIALFLMSLVKIGLIQAKADILWFVIASVMDNALLGIFLVISFIKTHNIKFISEFNRVVAKSMLKSSWPLVLSAVASLIYMRIDQVMIRNMLGLHEVGIYSAAVKVYESWIVFPYIITISLLPAIAKLKQGDVKLYYKRLGQLFSLVIWLSIIAAFFVSGFSQSVMVIAFGEAYKSSASVVSIVMWTAVFASMGSVSARYFNVEKMEKKIAARTIFAAVINTVLNLFLIPKYGVNGAAFATLICTFFSNYLMDWFDKDLRVLLKIKHRAILVYPLKRVIND